MFSHFRMPDSKRWSWRHPHNRSRAVLDNVFVPASHTCFISPCFTPADFAVYLDNRPVICELNFIPKTTPRIAKRLPSQEIRSLNQGETMEAYQADIALALGDTDPSSLHADELASTIRAVAVNSAQNIIPAKILVNFQ